MAPALRCEALPLLNSMMLNIFDKPLSFLPFMRRCNRPDLISKEEENALLIELRVYQASALRADEDQDGGKIY